MRRALLLMFFFATPLFAAENPTTSLLTAVRVNDVIRFEADKSKVSYRVDDRFGGLLAEGKSENFAAPHGVDLTYFNYNPFKVTVTSTETAVADPNQKAIGDFLDALKAFAGGIAPGPATTTANLLAARAPRSVFHDLTHPSEPCLDSGTFQALGAPSLRAHELEPEPIGHAVNRWLTNATGRTAIQKVRDEAAEIRLSVAANVKTAQTALSNAADKTCTEPTETIVKTAKLIADNKELLRTLDTIIKLLDGYLGQRWHNDGDLVVRQVNSDPAQQKNVYLVFTLQKYTFDADANTIKAEADGELKRSLNIRGYRRFVPEVGVAAVYNELKYPKYTADKQTDGTFLVKKETSKSNVDAAMTLNMLCNCFGSDFLFPGFQIGLSTAKDYPGIMAGGVLRFAQPKQMSVAFGRMVTWYKDLDKLEVDKPVASQDALDKDLKRKRSPAAWYFAVQYTF